jgi:hypothetical protein
MGGTGFLFHQGRVWTTDAPTGKRLKLTLYCEGAGVEMEMASLPLEGKGVSVGAVLIVSIRLLRKNGKSAFPKVNQ